MFSNDQDIFLDDLTELNSLGERIKKLRIVLCLSQREFGKRIGSAYHDRISAGQALGQKNTVLAIWMAVTYLNPLSSVGPGSYVVWQNIFNSYQLWKKRKSEMK